jgi:hypothetical protein
MAKVQCALVDRYDSGRHVEAGTGAQLLREGRVET